MMQIQMTDAQTYSASALLGVLAGMRSMSAPAVIAQLSEAGALDEVSGALTLLKSGGFGVASRLLAGGEMLADKLPSIPNRISVGPLAGRAVIGGLSGAVISSANRKSIFAGALLGAAAAIGAAYGAYALRKQIGKKFNVPDAAIAVTEDILVAALGSALTKRLSASARVVPL